MRDFLQPLILLIMIFGGGIGLLAAVAENSVGILVLVILAEGILYLALKGADF